MRVEVRKSKIHGKGLFVKNRLSKGDFVAYIKGNISTVKKQLLYTKEEALMNSDWVGISMTYWIDPDLPFKYLNHSCDPSCGIKGKRSLYALRDLNIGDEITIDYSTIEGNPYWKMDCNCGSSKCRRIIKSISDLPEELFKKYYPFIPTALRNFYMKIKYKNVFYKKDNLKILKDNILYRR